MKLTNIFIISAVYFLYVSIHYFYVELIYMPLALQIIYASLGYFSAKLIFPYFGEKFGFIAIICVPLFSPIFFMVKSGYDVSPLYGVLFINGLVYLISAMLFYHLEFKRR